MNHHRTRLIGIRLMALAIFVLSISSVWAQTWTKEIAKGVTFMQRMVCQDGSSTPVSPQIINLITVDPKASGVRVQAVLAQDKVMAKDPTKGREVVSSVARRLDAVAVVNADFFPFTGDVLNLHISGGELMSEPNPKRVVFGLTSDGRSLVDTVDLDARVTLDSGKWFPIQGINGPREQHKLIAYTARFGDSTGTTTGGSEAVIRCETFPVRVGVPIAGTVIETRTQAGDTPIPDGCIVLSGSGTGQKFVDDSLKPGTSVTMLFNLKPTRTEGWEKVVEAVGGGPWLVKDGKVSVDGAAQGFQPGFYAAPHPRTAMGVTRDGKLVLATVDGRQHISAGMTLPQLAEVMLSLGCVEAINLDGGGSTTMATSSGILNSPSEGIERAVANAVAVFAYPLETGCPEFSISPITEPIPAGEIRQITLVDSGGNPLSPELAGRAVWTATGGAGFVDQSGCFHGIRTRKASLTARIGSRVASIPVEITAGQPAKLTAKFEADSAGATNRSSMVVTVSDRFGNGLAGCPVAVKVVGGIADQASLVTGKDGRAITGITWDAAPGAAARATLTSGNLSPVTLDRLK